MFGFKRLPKPQKPGKPVKREKPAKHVYAVGEKVCFSLSDPKTRETVWHMGEIVAIVLSPSDPTGKPTKVQVVPFELIDSTLKPREVEDWEADAPPYFAVPSEVLILDRLLSQLEWRDRKLPIKVEVELEKVCLAKHVPFLNLFAPLKQQSLWDQMSSYRHKW